MLIVQMQLRSIVRSWTLIAALRAAHELLVIIMAVASVPVPGLNILLLEYRYR